MFPFLASAVFLLGYLLITLEAKVKVSKSAFALAIGGILWVILALYDKALAHEEIVHVSYEIFSIVAFLLAAMSLVEILVHYRLFDVIRAKLLAYRLSNKAQFVVISALAFVLSALIDNLTTTIIMVQIARKFFKDENLLTAVVAIVIAANAGGAFSPIGDVTTIMLWLANKFSAGAVIVQGILPALTLLGVALLMLLPRVKPAEDDTIDDPNVEPLSPGEMVIIGCVAVSFVLPIAVKAIGLPPV
ncbi:MAG TPA: sodium:proton antiporter NhaD, partial [Candidatus Paceibacterota bacterium]|nr:sodium:proton antiporter NhaD [Candidatus Paceibacterota bacterium]